MAEYIGEIYLIKNKKNGKCYIGQAKKTVGVVGLTWGTNGRWKSHVREAMNADKNGNKDHCVLLNNAIRFYGEDGFEVTKLCDCATIEEMDEKERAFIIEYNSKAPHGYNLKDGGGRGKDSEETKEKKRLMRLGKKHDEKTRESIAQGQIGNRRGTKARKNPEDANLPKYIVAKRLGDKIIGYAVKCFPMGINEVKYVSKSFTNKENPQDAFDKAVQFVKDCEKEYEDLLAKFNKTIIKEKPFKSVERKAHADKKGLDQFDIPKYIYMIENGFTVDGLRIIEEDGTIKRYSKVFQNKACTMEEKLQLAIDHLEEIKKTRKCLIDDHVNSSEASSSKS